MLWLSNETLSIDKEERDAYCSQTKLIGDLEGAKEKVKKLRALMKKIDSSEAGIFKAAVDPSRIRILKLLKEGELCVCEIMTALDRPQSTTSHHLSIIEKGWVDKGASGRKVVALPISGWGGNKYAQPSQGAEGYMICPVTIGWLKDFNILPYFRICVRRTRN
jgi:predicted transcriptional regulator